jgi:hypothetical protein
VNKIYDTIFVCLIWAAWLIITFSRLYFCLRSRISVLQTLLHFLYHKSKQLQQLKNCLFLFKKKSLRSADSHIPHRTTRRQNAFAPGTKVKNLKRGACPIVILLPLKSVPLTYLVNGGKIKRYFRFVLLYFAKSNLQ